MIYDDLVPITRDEYRAAFHSTCAVKAAEALLRIAWHDEDMSWAESQCAAALADSRPQIRLAAATALGHVARRQKWLQRNTIDQLRGLKDDPEIGGTVEDALDDLDIFGRKRSDG